MVLGIVLTLMTAAAVMCVLWPLARRRTVAAAASGEAAVYRDQLAEVERESARGIIPVEEAAAARTEIARRLIAASEAPQPAPQTAGPAATRRRRMAALAGLAGVPLVALMVYGALGRPDLPDLPLAERQMTPDEGFASLIARVEAEVSRRPEDGRGWEVLAPVYLRMGRAQDAATAYGNAIRLLGTTPAREAGLGEALTFANDGTVTPEAKAAFERALSQESGFPQARFYLGRAAEQAGDMAEAADIYRALLVEAPPNAPWRGAARQALASAALGPDGQVPAVDPQTLASQSPDQRMVTIRAMVEGLESRLKGDPGDLAGQLRLIRAWTMLGDADKAKAAASEARGAFAGKEAELRRIDDLVLGLDLEENPA
ncbi:c-type cytochrome biogenesis protein CcmI [Terrihabitans sp. B22-R8]|uniref:c-type cytochrome biogenesis protein CcmI n=1 Tax=Terrihabitans sp. B22-R8 TaxID=3425128 RepID=UPI00403C7913